MPNTPSVSIRCWLHKSRRSDRELAITQDGDLCCMSFLFLPSFPVVSLQWGIKFPTMFFFLLLFLMSVRLNLQRHQSYQIWHCVSHSRPDSHVSVVTQATRDSWPTNFTTVLTAHLGHNQGTLGENMIDRLSKENKYLYTVYNIYHIIQFTSRRQTLILKVYDPDSPQNILDTET